MRINGCPHLPELLAVEIPALEQAVKRNEYYLGEASRQYIGDGQAREDFYNNHLQQYWGEIFKALFCANKCPDGKIDNCETAIEKGYLALAERFKAEVDRFGIDAVLSGGNATEAVFTRYREMVEAEGAS